MNLRSMSSCGLLVAGLLSIPLIAHSDRAPLEKADATAAKLAPVTLRGTVDGWRIQGAGPVFFRLRVEAEGNRPARQFWFRSPPSRTQTTNFEEVLFEAIMSDRKDPWEVEGVRESGADGSTPERSIRLEAITRLWS